jgi:hypothetical protein
MAYERLFGIAAGETQTEMLKLTFGSLSRNDDLENQVLYADDYVILINVEQSTEQMWNFTVSRSEKTLEEWPQVPQGV